MAIQASEVHLRLSGGASNALPAASLGGIKSSNDAPSGVFDDVSSVEAGAGDVEYRCVYVHNANSSLTLVGAQLAILTNTPDTQTNIDVGLGTSAVNGTEQTVTDENTAPAGVTFGAGPLSLGDIPAGQHRAVWLRRTVSANAAAYADSFSLRVIGDTNP